MKYKVSFVQPNFKQGPGGIASYLPYSCGLLWSYAKTKKIISESLKQALRYNISLVNKADRGGLTWPTEAAMSVRGCA